MESVKNFLESSTIHGLAYIPTGRKFVRLFWVLVVIAGFTGAGVIIHQSFQSWDESPVKTTIETHPRAEITFPKVTVCPPKNTYTDLNYDLMMTQNMTVDKETRSKLANFANEQLYDHMYNVIMQNISKLEDNNRYYGWYHGYTKIDLPWYAGSLYGSKYHVNTAALSGSISTKYFGDKYDATKVEPHTYYTISIFPPVSFKNVTNVTLHIEIQKVSMIHLTTGKDRIYLNYQQLDSSHFRKNITPPLENESQQKHYISFIRSVIQNDVENQKLDTMPGFKLTWSYSGLVKEPMTVALYANDSITKAFVRNVSTGISLYSDT